MPPSNALWKYPVHGNAGEVVADMESPTTTMRWLQYSLAGQPWENGPNTY